MSNWRQVHELISSSKPSLNFKTPCLLPRKGKAESWRPTILFSESFFFFFWSFRALHHHANSLSHLVKFNYSQANSDTFSWNPSSSSLFSHSNHSPTSFSFPFRIILVDEQRKVTEHLHPRWTAGPWILNDQQIKNRWAHSCSPPFGETTVWRIWCGAQLFLWFVAKSAKLSLLLSHIPSF